MRIVRECGGLWGFWYEQHDLQALIVAAVRRRLRTGIACQRLYAHPPDGGRKPEHPTSISFPWRKTQHRGRRPEKWL